MGSARPPLSMGLYRSMATLISSRHGGLGFMGKERDDHGNEETRGTEEDGCDPNDEPPDGEPWPLVRSLLGSISGYMNVQYNSTPRAKKRPWQAKRKDGTSLGMFETAEQAAEAHSRWLGFKAAQLMARSVEAEIAARDEAKRHEPEDALETARREGLTLLRSDGGTSSTPYRNVYKIADGPRCYFAKLWYGGKKHSLGCFFSAEAAALAVARTRRAAELAKEE